MDIKRYFLILVANMVLMAGLIQLSTSMAYAQGTDLFTPLPADQLRDMSPAHTQRVDQIKQRPTTASMTVVRVDANALKGDSTRMALPGDKTLTFSKVNIETRSEKDFTWNGSLAGIPGNATIVVHDGNITGSVRDSENLYRIEPIGKGVHAIIKVDESRFPPDHPPTFKDKEKRGDTGTGSMSAATRDTQTADSPLEIDVLVAYTPAARSAVFDIAGTIQLAVDEANGSYKNSGVDIKLTLVDSFEKSYSESGKSFETILADFKAMTDIQGKRDGSGADMIVMIINQADYCGLADAIKADASNAYAIVHYNCATGYYSFAHELGHLQGARHDQKNDSSSTPFQYGHGYQHPASLPSERFRTIMAYRCDTPDNCEPRVQHWSNPNINYNGIPTGTTATNNNARVLNETASTVAGFRKPTYSRCATENGTCSFSGTKNVAYGANGQFSYKTATNGIACNNATFGDPIVGVVKACYIGPASYSHCATENGTCSFSGTKNVAYGANRQFSYKTATNGIACNNATFGDPIVGVVKACYIGPASYSHCATENGTCSFSGTKNVAYGANGQFSYKTATNGIACNNATFGDPIVGVVKACYSKDSRPGDVGVPDVESFPFTRAKKAIEEAGLKPRFSCGNNCTDEYHVIRQRPAPGTEVPPGSQVSCTMKTGPIP